MVTLERGQGAGGHVKCWERFAEAAASLPEALNLDLHFLGASEEIEILAPNVRFYHHRPILGTNQLPFLKQGAGDTDLSPRHAGLARAIAKSDILHVTDFFSFGRTALAWAGRCPITASVHTDVPRFVGVYSQDIIRRAFGNSLGRIFVDRWRVHEWLAARAQRSIDRDLSRSAHVLVSKKEDFERLGAILPKGHIGILRRGVDRESFHPSHRDRARLHAVFGIPEDRQVVLFVGRIDSSKSAMVMAEAVHILIERGYDLHALLIGEGGERSLIGNLLGDRVSSPGWVDQKTLAWLYASADLFLFPSITEVSPNVVLEAKASGLPVVVANGNGGGQFIAANGHDGVTLDTQESAVWAQAAEALLRDKDRRANMAKAARAWIETAWPSWRQVLAEDLLPIWRRIACASTQAVQDAPDDRAFKD